MATLMRVRVTPPTDDLQQKLLDDCATELGYTGSCIAGNPAVLNILDEIHVAPFEADSVLTWKAAQSVPAFFWWTFFICLPLVLILLIGSVVATFWANDIKWMCGWVIMLVPMITLLIHMSFFKVWNKTELNKYRPPIPEYALQTALNTKRALTAAGISFKLWIDELETTDPFLVLEVNNEYYYLEVWLEPGFKVKRQY